MFDLGAWLTAFLDQIAAFFSVLVTLLVFHKVLSPRVAFSEFVRSEEVPQKGRQRYSIKLAKTGKIDLVDVRISCRLYVKDVFSTGGRMWTTFPIPVTYAESAVLGKDERVIYLSLHKSSIAEDGNGVAVKKKILERFKTSELSFERILIVFPKSYLKVDLVGNDRFTGILKVYISNRYGLWALRAGKWKSDSTELIRSD